MKNLRQNIRDRIVVHRDCRHYRGCMPCKFHKTDGRLCNWCPDYDQIQTRILIVKLAAIGDVLRTTSILPPLKHKYPHAEITWITRANAKPLIESSPWVDRCLTVEDHYLEFLGNESFSVGICLDTDIYSATILSLARCDKRFGFVADSSGRVAPVNHAAQEWWLMSLNDQLKRENRKTYQQLMYEICDLPLPTVPPQLHLNGAESPLNEWLLRRNGFQIGRKLIGINTGGGGRWQLKKWTLPGYIRCIDLLKTKYPQADLVLLGGPEEVETNERILQAVGDKVVNGGCNNPLMTFAAMINRLDLLVTSDSLAMHLAVALGKPTIVLVGPTSPWELDVFGKGTVLHSDIECLSCYLSRCNKTDNCMNRLSPEQVVAAVSTFL